MKVLKKKKDSLFVTITICYRNELELRRDRFDKCYRGWDIVEENGNTITYKISKKSDGKPSESFKKLEIR